MENIYDTIENYLRGKLPEEEERAFAKRLQQEPELDTEVQAFRLAQDIVEESIADQLRNDFTTWDQVSETAEKPATTSAKIVRMRSMRKVLSIAAGVLLLISVAFLQYRSTQQNYNSATLAAVYHDTDLGFTRSNAGDDNELSAATKALQANNFTLAIQELQTIPTSSAYYQKARLLLADAYFLNDQLDLAKSTSTSLLAAGDPLLQEKAEWLNILIDLKAGKKNDSEFQLKLKEISTNTAHSFQPQATELFDELDGFWVKWVE